MAYPSTPGHQSDPYTPRHVRDAIRHARTVLPRDHVAFEVLVFLASGADRNGTLDPAPGTRYLADFIVRSPRTAGRALGRLDANGLITWSRRRGRTSRIVLSWVIHSASPLLRPTSLSTGGSKGPPKGPEVGHHYCDPEEAPNGAEEDARAIDCLGCGRPAGRDCPLAEASGCQRIDQLAHVIDLSTAFARAHP